MQLAAGDDIGGEFQIMNAIKGRTRRKWPTDTAKLITTAAKDGETEYSSPSNGASMPLMSALPSAVSNRISGNLIAVNNACCGSRHQPMAAP